MFRALRKWEGQRGGSQHPNSHLSPQRLEGDLELLAVFTHVAVAVSVALLLLTAALLLSLRSLKSNTRRIHAHVAAALGTAELLFLLGIHRTHNQVQGQGSGRPRARGRALRPGRCGAVLGQALPVG